jgi:hypothetical protein
LNLVSVACCLARCGRWTTLKRPIRKEASVTKPWPRIGVRQADRRGCCSSGWHLRVPMEGPSPLLQTIQRSSPQIAHICDIGRPERERRRRPTLGSRDLKSTSHGSITFYVVLTLSLLYATTPKQPWRPSFEARSTSYEYGNFWASCHPQTHRKQHSLSHSYDAARLEVLE